MNPYTYGKRKAVSASAKNSLAHSIGSWAVDIFNAPINSLAALLFVLFAATTVSGMAALAYPEISSAVDPSPLVALAHSPLKLLSYTGRVLGDTTSTIRTGQVVYNPSSKTVYLVGSSGLYGFTDAPTFYAWKFTFSQVVPENAVEQNLSVLGNVPMPQNGCSAPLDQINGTCTSQASGNAGAGRDPGYTRVGQLVYAPSNKTIYLVGNSGLYGFPDAATFYSWGYTFSQVLPANTAELGLNQAGLVPFKRDECGKPLDQINNTCQTPTAGSLSNPVITGPGVVSAGSFGNFNFVSTSPYGSLNYSINWGDGTNPSPSTNLTSGDTNTQTHIWATPGSFTITASVTDAAGNKASATFPVQVSASTVVASTVFQLSQSAFNFTAQQGDVIYQQQSGVLVNVTNSAVNYSISVDNQPAWFNTSYTTETISTSPGAQNGIGVGVNPSGLAVGTYTSTVKISGNFAGSPIIIPVTLTITAALPSVQTLNINQFSVLPATVGQAYSNNAITFTQSGSVNPILVTFSGLPAGIGMPETMSPGQVFNSEQFSQNEKTFPVALVGTPIQAGTYSVTLTVSNQSTLTKTQTFSFIVNPAQGGGGGGSSNIRVGQLVYSAGDRTIYLVAPNGLYGFTDAQTFYNWGFNFNNILQATSAEKAMPVLGNVPAKLAGCNSPLDQINGNCGTTVGGALNVSLAAISPAPDSSPSGGANIPFATFMVSAAQSPVAINTLTLHRTGTGADSNFTSVALYNGDQMLGQSTTVQNGTAIFAPYRSSLVTVAANTSLYLTVKASLATGISAGVTNAFGFTSSADFGTSAGTVTGSFPVTGSLMTVVSVSSPNLAKLNVIPYGVGTGATVGFTGAQVGNFRLQALNGTVNITGLNLTFSGGTPSAALANIKVMVNGTQAGNTAAGLSSYGGALAIDFSGSPIVIPVGQVTSIIVLADVIGGANTTVTVSLQSATDVKAVDASYNVSITPAMDPSSSQGGTFPLQIGTISITPAGGVAVRLGAIINNNGTVQLVGQNGLYGFPDVATFNSWGFSFSNLVTANSAEKVLSQIGVVPMKQAGCSSPLDQIAGKCGSSLSPVTVTTSDSLTLTQGTYGQITFRAGIGSISNASQTTIYTFTETGKVPGMVFENRCNNLKGGDVACPLVNLNSISLDGVPTQAGTFPVTITATDPNGTTGSQSFTVTVNGVTQPSGAIVITSPAGGESWVLGSTHTITWDSTTPGGWPLTITLNGTGGSTIITSAAANTGSYSWTISNSVTVGTYSIGLNGPSMCTSSYPSRCYGTPGTSQTFKIVNPTNSVVNISSLLPTTGLVGTQVAITGSGFTSDNKISFGNADLGSQISSYSSADGKTIIFIVPSVITPSSPNCQAPIYCVSPAPRSVVPGVYSISITNSNGTSNVLPFTVTGTVTPTISSLLPTTGPAGTQVVITGVNFTTTDNTIKMGNYQVGSVNSTDGKTLSFTVPQSFSNCNYTAAYGYCTNVYIPVNAGDYQVTVTNSKGTSNSQTFSIIRFPIICNPTYCAAPPVGYYYQQTPGGVCGCGTLTPISGY